MDTFQIDWAMDPEKTVLKPCPFCGVVPVLRCDIVAPGYGEPLLPEYTLEAYHKYDCYIRRINRENDTGKMTAHNWQYLVSHWNWRNE